MSEWWTYELSDFLMFAPATYWRLVELYNRGLWPGPVVAAAAGLAGWLASAVRPGGRGRFTLSVLAAAWCWVAWAFYWERLAQIRAVAPEVVFTTNIGCRLYLAAGLRAQGLATPVRHPITLIAESMPS